MKTTAAVLATRLDRLDHAFVFEKAIDRETYEQQRDLLRDEIAIAEIDIPTAQNSEGTVASVLGFTSYFVSNISSLWVEATPELKRQLRPPWFQLASTGMVLLLEPL